MRLSPCMTARSSSAKASCGHLRPVDWIPAVPFTLVPRGLALVGIVGAPILLAGYLAVMFGLLGQHAPLAFSCPQFRSRSLSCRWASGWWSKASRHRKRPSASSLRSERSHTLTAARRWAAVSVRLCQLSDKVHLNRVRKCPCHRFNLYPYIYILKITRMIAQHECNHFTHKKKGRNS